MKGLKDAIRDGDIRFVEFKEDNTFKAYSESNAELHEIYTEKEKYRNNPKGFDDKKTEEFLLNARVVKSKLIRTGITKSRVLELEHDGLKRKAIFKKRFVHSNDHYCSDCICEKHLFLFIEPKSRSFFFFYYTFESWRFCYLSPFFYFIIGTV